VAVKKTGGFRRNIPKADDWAYLTEYFLQRLFGLIEWDVPNYPLRTQLKQEGMKGGATQDCKGTVLNTTLFGLFCAMRLL
jgi:hypothetical protein